MVWGRAPTVVPPAAVVPVACVPTLAALAGYDISTFPDGAIGEVRSVGDQFDLQLTPTAETLAAADGVTIVQCLGFPTCCWTRRGLEQPSFWTQADWYVAFGGNDDANGATVGTPLATVEELCRRLRGAVFRSPVTTVHIAGCSGRLELDVTVPAGLLLRIVGASTPTAADVFAAVAGQDPTTNTRAGYTATAAPGASGLLARVRPTNGAAPGVLAFVTRAVGGAVYEVSQWCLPPDPTAGEILANGAFSPAPGDSYVIDQLSTNALLSSDVKVRGGGRVTIENCEFWAVGAHRFANDELTQNAGVELIGCKTVGVVTFTESDFAAACCLFSTLVIFANCRVLNAGGNVFAQGLTQLGGVTRWEVCAAFPASGGNNTGIGLWLREGACAVTGTANGNIQWCADGVAPAQLNAICIEAGCSFAEPEAFYLWGKDCTFGDAAIRLRPCSSFVYDATTLPTIPGGGSDVAIAANQVPFAALPIFDTTSGAAAVERA